MTAVPTVLDERFRAAAAASGELDVAYDVLGDTPVGRLLVGVSEHGLCRVGFDPEPEAELERLARHFGLRVLRSPNALDRVRRELDAPRAARAVGTVMNRNPLPIVLPCHRVVGANGSLTGYGGGLDRKEWLLRLEGALL